MSTMSDSSKKPDFQRLLEFQKLMLQFRAIERKVHIPPELTAMENDVEHSYDLTMLAWFIAQYFPHLDTDKIIRYCLAHDLVEIHAGDTFSYGDEALLASKAVREKVAIEKLRAEWSDFPEAFAAIDGYEALKTPEAKFVYALDKVAPAMIDYLNEGRGWRKLKITASKFRTEKNSKVPISPEINEFMDQFHAVLADQLHLFSPEDSEV